MFPFLIIYGITLVIFWFKWMGRSAYKTTRLKFLIRTIVAFIPILNTIFLVKLIVTDPGFQFKEFWTEEITISETDLPEYYD